MVLARGCRIFEVRCSPFIPAAHEGDVNRVLGEFHPRASTPMSLGFFPVFCARTATNVLWSVGSVIIGTETSFVRPASLAACCALVRMALGFCICSLEIKNGTELPSKITRPR